MSQDQFEQGKSFLDEYSGDAYLTFSTDSGQRFLKHLEEFVLSKSYLTMSPMMADMGNISLNPSDLLFIREGQASVLRYINLLIKYYKAGKGVWTQQANPQNQQL